MSATTNAQASTRTAGARIAVGVAITAIAAVFIAGCGTSHPTTSAVVPSVAPVASSAVASVPASSAPASPFVSDSPMDSVLPSAPDVPSSVATAAELANLPVAKPMSKSVPVRVQVPSIGGRQHADGPRPARRRIAAGSAGARPLRAGTPVLRPLVSSDRRSSSVILTGQVSTACFYRLHSLLPGAEIDVTRVDGSTAVFRVLSVHEYAKDAFPTKLVYGNTAYSALRLITCGGAFNAKAHSYEDDIVAYAELVGLQSPRLCG